MSKRLTRFATILALLAFLITASCSRQSGNSGNVDYWTCTMHPSVHSKDPGKCPICSMDLVPVMKKGSETKPSPSRQGERKIKYYKSTMMPGEISAKPAKDSMGMDMVPAYEDEKPGAAN